MGDSVLLNYAALSVTAIGMLVPAIVIAAMMFIAVYVVEHADEVGDETEGESENGKPKTEI